MVVVCDDAMLGLVQHANGQPASQPACASLDVPSAFFQVLSVTKSRASKRRWLSLLRDEGWWVVLPVESCDFAVPAAGLFPWTKLQQRFRLVCL